MKYLITVFFILSAGFPEIASGKAISYEVNGKTFEGYFISPSPKAPLILLIHEWDGLTDYEIKRANMLADLDYSVFAADLFGAGIRKFVESLSDENSRLLNQRGLFTIPMSEEVEIANTVQNYHTADPEKGKSRIIFVKIKLLDIEGKKCLRNLNTMNINHPTLFPDLIGAAEYCNVKLDIEDYT